MNADADVIDQAICWHIRLADAPDTDWADFVAWLEADPAHAEAYGTIAAQDRLIDRERFPQFVSEPVAANDNVRARWPWLVGGTAAAAVVAALFVPAIIAPRSSPYEVATRAGERRTVALGDGTRIEMSGGTTLTLDRADPRVASLDGGEAMFHVRHDDGHPFVMTAGSVTIRDLGTVFNIARDGQNLSVAVSEGSIMFQPGRDALTLKAGDILSAHSDGSRVARSRIDPGSIGSWRSGMLSFDGQRLGDVVATIERQYGFRISLAGALPDRPFTGMVRFTGAADKDVPHLAVLIGATWRRDGEQWMLSEGVGASR
ncbi:FecR domain-containing protein [Sphingomonas bacterium]|uniref:FecR family protein n=1 Tax=Sphingomonas bacterium TaxID=1895847 RepID=UPI00262F5EB3|nr:FecR domain-containing protein [Sphingomonas bacterium]MDB5678955.1 hypothetical protein [Sphingomonas bacterium]